jgi:chemotaxis protein methyltransferase CheR
MSTAKKLENPKFVIQTSFDYQELELSTKSFELFARKMYELAGVDLPYSPKNHALLRNRLIKILRNHELTSYEDYWSLLKAGSNDVVSEFISALTTNMTSFYRESAHFDFLTKILPEKFGKLPEVRIWCCAASTGQEPYTIGITANEALGQSRPGRIRILATDIDKEVLKKASIGKYDEKDLQGLNPMLRERYFDKVKGHYQANDDLHNMIHFAYFNLMNPSYQFQNKFHVIFCRNVLIYFDEETVKKVISNLASVLVPGGYLILGHSESGNVKHDNLKSLSRAIFQKV